jgi:RNA polymerase sigma factor (TIGR02999 family)
VFTPCYDLAIHLMTAAAQSEITRLLADWAGGDRAALDRLAPLVLAELRRIASRQMQRERPGHTLQPTALVNEAFLRLAGGDAATWQDRAHFFAVCARVMRRVLIDHARSHARDKRGGGAVHVPLDQAATLIQQTGVDLIALGDALTALEAFDARKARIVELRYFAGLGIEETAGLLKVSPMTVRREWTRAKAWLHRQLVEGAGH